MTCSQAIQELGNLSQGELRVPVYKERFHLLAERAALDAKDCVNLFFDDLKPSLKLAINIRGHGSSLEETCKELKRIEARLPASETAPTEPWKKVLPWPAQSLMIFDHVINLLPLIFCFLFMFFLLIW